MGLLGYRKCSFVVPVCHRPIGYIGSKVSNCTIHFLAKLLHGKIQQRCWKVRKPKIFFGELGGPGGLKDEPITLTGHNVTPGTSKKMFLA